MPAMSARTVGAVACAAVCMACASPAAFLLARADKVAFRTADDPEPQEPPQGWMWGSVDANMDWCERNYSTTIYVAEFWNAISSLPIFFFALVGYIAGKRYAMAETRFSLAFFIVMLVGLGSFMFHATLRRYAQCMDELPMLWTSIALFYNTIDHKPNVDDPAWVHPGFSRNSQTRPPPRTSAKFVPLLPAHPSFHRSALKAALILAGIGLTSIYFWFPQFFVVFFIGYSTFLVTFVGMMAFHLFFSKRAARKNRMSVAGGYESVPLEVTVVNSSAINNVDNNVPALAASNAQQVASRPYTPVLGKLYWMAIAGYFGGFVFWLYENTYCTSLPDYVQLHAVWHLMAGLGSFCTIQCQLAWRAEELGGRTSIDMDLGGGILPIVVVKYTQSE